MSGDLATAVSGAVGEAEEKDFAPGLERAFAQPPPEASYVVRRISGRLPEFLRGTWFMNGPARFQRGGAAYRHWLDGDGMLLAACFRDGEVRITQRYVHSAKWRGEEAAGRPLYRTFGTAFPGDRLVRGVLVQSPVNVSAVPFGGRLLALGEQGLPWELDPATLETRGPFSFGGAINELSPFAAHAKVDPESGELFNFGVSFSSTQPTLQLYRFSPEGRLVARRRQPLPYPASIHDFCLSRRHAAFYVTPYLLDMAALAQEGKTLMESLSWEPERGSRLLVMDRETGELRADLPLGGRACLHGINAFEGAQGSEAGELLTVDVLELDRPVYDQYEVVPDLFRSVGPGRPERLVVDLARGALVSRSEIDYPLAPDFPVVDPQLHGRPYDDFWLLGISAMGRPGRKFFDQLAHFAWSRPEARDVWTAPAGSYLAGEPAFAGDPGRPGVGAVICPLFDAGAGPRGEHRVLVFDAYDVAAGPRAVLSLEAPLHLGFHSVFDPAATGLSSTR